MLRLPELRWNPDAYGGQGAYQFQLREFVTVSSGTSHTRAGSASRVAEAPPAEYGAVDAFQQRLRRALESHAFLALTVSPRRLSGAERALASAFPIDVRSIDGLLIRHVKEAAHDAGADWRTVLRADRQSRESADLATLMRLIDAHSLGVAGHAATGRTCSVTAS